MIKVIQLIGIWLLGGFMMNQAVASETCYDKWMELVDKQLPYNEMIPQWQTQKSDCGKSGEYYFRFSNLYRAMGELDQARQVLNDARDKVHEDAWFIDYGLINIDEHELYKKGNPTKDELEKVIVKYQEFDKQHPGYYGTYFSLSGLLILTEDYESALAMANEANEKEPTFYAYRSATIANYNLGLYHNALLSGKRAVELDSEAMADRDFMLTMAYAYTQLKMWKSARIMLGTLLDKKPEVGDDPEFSRAVYFYQLKKKEEEQKKDTAASE